MLKVRNFLEFGREKLSIRKQSRCCTVNAQCHSWLQIDSAGIVYVILKQSLLTIRMLFAKRKNKKHRRYKRSKWGLHLYKQCNKQRALHANAENLKILHRQDTLVDNYETIITIVIITILVLPAPSTWLQRGSIMQVNVYQLQNYPAPVQHLRNFCPIRIDYVKLKESYTYQMEYVLQNTRKKEKRKHTKGDTKIPVNIVICKKKI